MTEVGVIRRAKLQSNRRHQQTNIGLTGRMPFPSPNQQCQSTEGKTTAWSVTLGMQHVEHIAVELQDHTRALRASIAWLSHCRLVLSKSSSMPVLASHNRT